MDLNFLMTNMLSGPSLEQSIKSKTSFDGDSGFGDVLGFVDALEVSELSSATNAEESWSEAISLMDNQEEAELSLNKRQALDALTLKSDGAQLNLVDAQTNENMLGQKVANESSESFSKHVLLNTETYVAPNSKVLQHSQTRLSDQSVASWTTALSSDELKSVEVLQESAEVSGLAKPKEVALSAVEILEKDSNKSVVPVRDQKEDSLSDEGFRQKTFSLDNAITDSFDTKKPKVAKDLFLDMAGVATLSQGKNVAKATSALETQSFAKVDAQVLDFVADKVQDLQASGGGTIRVGLETKDAGDLQIKVSMRQGQLEVKIDGTDTQLTRELGLRKSELLSKLEKVSEVASLEIGKDVASFLKPHEQLSNSRMAYLSSDEIIKNMSGTEIADTSVAGQNFGERDNLSAIAQGEESARSSGSESGFGDDRRQKAMSQWEDFSERLRKSA